MQKNKKRPDGRIVKKVFLGSYNGRKNYKFVYGSTQKEVEEKANEIKRLLNKGIDISAERDTFKDWAEQWRKIKKHELSTGRYNICKYRIDNLSPLHDMPITEIKTIDIQNIIFDLDEYASSTLKEVKNTASAIFQLAIDNRVLDYNPATAVKIPRKPESTKRRALNETERQWIIDTPHRAQTAAMIMMYAGLRRGELIPLVWTDIDLENATIDVNKSVELINGKPNIKETAKTDKSIRTVDIPQVLVDYLRTVKRTGFLVCPNTRGKIMSGSSWKKMWESYLTDLNLKYGDFSNNLSTKGKRPKSKFLPEKIDFVIPRFTAHWLRHTFITLMYFAGVDIMTARDQAGHADIKTTMEIYTHLDREHKKKSMSKLDDYLSGLDEQKRQKQIN